MASSLYRQAPLTLQDILTGANARADAGPSVPQPPDPSQVEMPGLLSPQDRSRLLSALLQPEDVGPAPTQTDPTSSAIGMAFSGLGDALNALNAGRSQQPGFRSDYSGQALYRIDQQRAEQQAYQERKAASERRAKDRGVNYLLSADDKAQIRAQEQAGRLELKNLTIAQQEEDRKARIAAAAQTAQYHSDEIASREKIATMETNARIASDKLQAGLHAAKKTDEADKEQHDEYKKVRMWAVANKSDILAKVQKGELTTDQARQTLSDMLDASDLTGKYLDAAKAFLELQLGVPFAKHDFAQQYEPQGPDRPGALPVPAGTPTLRNPRGVGGGI